jgi:hypothetical protein
MGLPPGSGGEAVTAGSHSPAGTESDALKPGQPPGDSAEVSAWEAEWIDLGGEG